MSSSSSISSDSSDSSASADPSVTSVDATVLSSSMSSDSSDSSASSAPQAPQPTPGFTQFVADVPIVVPPKPAVSYPKYWMRLMTVSAPDPEIPCRIYAEMRPCRDVDGPMGKEVKKPEEDGDIKVVQIPDVFAVIYDPNESPEIRTYMAEAMEATFRAINAYAKSRGIF